MSRALLEIRNLTIGAAGKGRAPVKILDDVSLTLPPGGLWGIAGESGCGKSTLLLAMAAALKPGLARLGGSVALAGRSLFELPPAELERLRGGRIGLVPQNAGQALTPTLRIGAQIAESLLLHSALPRGAHAARVHELLRQVRIDEPERIARRYPHEISGGQQQRAAIAMALAGEPDLLLLDEPTTGLDVTVKRHLLALLRELHRATGVAMVCVSHDIAVLAELCDTVVVMYDGQVVETQPTAALLRRPLHPYSFSLLRAVPSVRRSVIPPSIPGSAPAPRAVRPPCRFLERCPDAQALCRATPPPAPALEPGPAAVRCHFPKTQPLEADLPGDTGEGVAALGPVILTIADLAVSYARPGPFAFLPGLRPRLPPVIAEVNLQLRRGELLGLVGESGSGKSTVLRSVAGLWPILAGQLRLDGDIDLGALVAARDPQVLRRVQLIFQNPDASLNPRQRVGQILAKPLKLYFGLRGRALEQRVGELLAEVRLEDSYRHRFPGQLSGGERQRVAIARAFAARPDVVLCDEITSALDISVQASVLRLIKDLSRQHGTASLFVTHDLGVVRALCDRVAVLFQGRICEYGEVAQVCDQPRHDYTRLLLGAVR